MNPATPPLEPSVLLEHAEFVRALARSLVADPGGADDIEQETWLRALRHGPRERTNLRGWLATVMHNSLRNRARERSRRERREREAARPERVAPSSLAAEHSDTLRSVVGAVVGLDEPYRSTVLSLYFQGLSSRELAEREGVPEATVRSRHKRALAKLREKLDNERGGRAQWCSALAALTGVDTGAKFGVSALALTVAAAVVALIGASVWISNARARTATPAVAASAVERSSIAATDEALNRQQVAPADRREPPSAPAASVAEVAQRPLRLADVEMRIEKDDGSAFAGVTVRVLLMDNETVLERVSDEHGIARFEQASNFGRFVAVAPGWAPVRYARPVERSDGVWDAGKIVLAPAGALRVRVMDGAGAPLEGANVLVARQPWERDLDGDSQWGATQALGDQSAQIEADGEALFETVAADVDLRVRVVRGRQVFVGEQRLADGRLIGLERDGLALRVPPGGELRVEARWNDVLTLDVAVVRADGAPPGSVHVQVLDLAQTSSDKRVVHDAFLQSPTAPVQLRLAAPELSGPLAVFAREEQRAANAPVGLGYLGGSAGPAPRVALARAQLELPRRHGQLDEAPLGVALKLEESLEITGKLLARDGSPAAHRQGGMGGYRVQVVPVGASAVNAPDLLHPQTRVEYIGASEFAVRQLAPGRYDLLVSDQIDAFYTFASSVRRFENIEAGAQGVELRLGDPGLVKVRLTTDAPASERGAGRMITLMGALTPRDGASVDTQAAARRQLVSGLAPWPDAAPRDFTGIDGGRDARGLWAFGCDSSDSAMLAALPELAPGWYVFGAHVTDVGGTSYAPAATQLAYYEAGEYTLDFRLLPVAEVLGVLRRGARQLVALELVTSNGELVRFRGSEDGRAATVTRRFAPATGVMRLSEVPHGRYRLRAGAPAQLDRGQFERELEIVVGPSGEPFELDLR